PGSKPAPELGPGDKLRDDGGRVGAVAIPQHDGGSESVCEAKSDTPSAIALHPFRPHSVHLIQTELPVVKRSVLDKTARLTQARLDASDSRIAAEDRCAHDADALAPLVAKGAQHADMTIVFGASAVVDADDVIPAAIRAAGGEIVRFGMPVDPGNLLVLGHVNGKPVIGAPGCARSPKENGFDWILNRLLAGVDVTDKDIATLGVGGLLMEIPTRPQPRETVSRAPSRIEAIILAAGQSRRMGAGNKLLATFDGEALIRRVARIALASSASAVTVVTGNRAAEIGAALAGLDVRIVHNPDFADGMSTSLRAGLEAMPAKTDGALVMLGDMPGVTAKGLDLLVDAFREAGGSAIVRATHNGKRGNPVILPRALFPRVADLSGDVGARHLVEGGFADTVDVELGAAASVDVDTPEALAAAGGVLGS
ncbi:MAG TPA: NTP transferase domain-containing protein, partial [Rhizobiaceae bacterium]|nr:NTP transferase domain-containing protein [Rhizobiaceae bacterium]